MADWRLDLFRSMPKAELHMHLDGAVGVRTAMQLGRAAAPQGQGGEWLSSYEAAHRKLVIGGPLSRQGELLGYYDTPLSLLQDAGAIDRVMGELLRGKAGDGVRYCEIRWAPRLHLGGGMSLRQALESVVAAKKRHCRRTGLRASLIAVGMRGEKPEANIGMLRQIAEAGLAGEIAAVDLAGNEADSPDPMLHAGFFAEARRMGLGVTLHCGELPGSAAAVRAAVESIRPDRVAHGAPAACDRGLCRLLRDSGIQLDLCPTSNIQAGLYSGYRAFPLMALRGMGVPVSISTDSPVISGLSLSEEYFMMSSLGGVAPAELWAINLASLEHIFAPESVKAGLRAEFAEWARGVGELA
ncbi:MAG: hypothetical protein LBS32_02760 [Clostridiales Family XIII bacterium]|jgi:adenosine deaminase|nr:hypothetical protein [Clostridiales Family XIII bacterium]